jgi:hypothetical protein
MSINQPIIGINIRRVESMAPTAMTFHDIYSITARSLLKRENDHIPTTIELKIFERTMKAI